MAKVMLIIDEPNSCISCPCIYFPNTPYLNPYCKGYSNLSVEETYKKEKPTWCPLREVPQKKDINEAILVSERGYVEGYNACLDELLGGGE